MRLDSDLLTRKQVRCWCFVAWCAASLVLQAQTAAPRLTKPRLLEALEYRALTPNELLERVQTRGTDFALTEVDRAELRQRGASPRLVTAIRDGYKPDAVPAGATAVEWNGLNLGAGGPLKRADVTGLLNAKIPLEKLLQAIELRGVDFALDTEANLDIWTAGGNLTLMGSLLLNSRSTETPDPPSKLFPVPTAEEIAARRSGQPAPAKPTPQPEPPALVVAAVPAPMAKTAPPTKQTAQKPPKPARGMAQAFVPNQTAAAAAVTPQPEPAPVVAKREAPAASPAPVLSAPLIERTPAVPAPSPAPAAPVVTPAVIPAAPVPEPQVAGQPMRIDPSLQATKLVTRVLPVYSQEAARRHLGGTVQVRILVGIDGKVKKAEALTGTPLLVGAATEAVKRWVYRPTLVDGKPVEVVSEVSLTFRSGNE